MEKIKLLPKVMNYTAGSLNFEVLKTDITANTASIFYQLLDVNGKVIESGNKMLKATDILTLIGATLDIAKVNELLSGFGIEADPVQPSPAAKFPKLPAQP